VSNFIPFGYSVLTRREADFNGDGRKDLLLVLGTKSDAARPRVLVILFQQASGQYALSVRSEAALPPAGRDPSEAVRLKKDTFQVAQPDADPATNATRTWQFGFRNGDWRLLSETVEVGAPRGVACPKLFGMPDNRCAGFRVETTFETGEQVGTAAPVDENKPGKMFRRQLAGLAAPSLATFTPKAWADLPE
jgi:hypothetical protein